MGISMFASEARPPAAAIQPAWRPMTSRTKTFVEVLDMERTSKLASRVETAMYFATEPNPGQLSVMGRSLSTVLGTWMAWMGTPVFSASCEILRQVSAESPPPL